ncbi:hypothetical protein DFP72DRAFT_1076332 [Ephemerocybe angulata]|uniref:Uncharacterized protein n=1 Tax=Ephemerocybe angulata TaxID=980116 RepID=A0A8H6LZ76_9AGAR|nr:hypothetical protein DFP72DRAFT_1076332 [Tulosesus angulatus]
MVSRNDTANNDRAEQYYALLGFWLGGLVYGLYCILFLLCVKIMVQKRGSHWTWSARVLSAVTYLMFILTTVYMGIDASRVLYAFSPEWTEDSNGQLPIYYLREHSSSRNFAIMILTAVLVWLGDVLAIFRCFIIWDKNWCIVLAPIALLSLSVVNAAIVTMALRHPDVVPPRFFQLLINIIFPINIAQICLTTGLIAFKIWYQYRVSRAAGLRMHGRGVGLLTIIRIVVESAMIFTVQQVVLGVVVYMRSPLYHIFNSMLSPSIGGIFALITIRVDEAKKDPTSQFTLPHIDPSPRPRSGIADDADLNDPAGRRNQGSAVTEEPIVSRSIASSGHHDCGPPMSLGSSTNEGVDLEKGTQDSEDRAQDAILIAKGT